MTHIGIRASRRHGARALVMMFWIGVALTGCDDRQQTQGTVTAPPAPKTASTTVQVATASVVEPKPAQTAKHEANDVIKWLEMIPNKILKRGDLPKADTPPGTVDTPSRIPISAAPPAAVPTAVTSSTIVAPPPSAAPTHEAAIAVTVPEKASLPTATTGSTRTAAPPPVQAKTVDVATATTNAPLPGPVAAPEPPPASAAPGTVALAKPSTTAGSNAPLALVHREQPSYPREAMRDRIGKGHVRARLYVAADGSVARVEILESRPRGVFDRSVMDAASRWKYAPPGEARTVETEFDFALDE